MIAGPLTERRKADRARMAAMVAALCAEMGADCTVRDDATHVFADGSRPSNTRRITCRVVAGDAVVGIDFDGGPYNSNPGVYCMPWNVAHGSDKRFSDAFAHAVGASVNPYHRRKCMGFARGIDDLLARLRSAIACALSGEAWEARQLAQQQTQED